MGKTWDTLLGRTSNLETSLQDSVRRTAYLKSRHESLISISSSDTVQFLKLGYNKQAVLRVEHLIKSRNMLDVLAMVETYCHLLMQRISLIERNNNFPEELKEAISSLVYASSRIGEFPELQHMRDYFGSKYGKEYLSQCIEFPLYSGVTEEFVQKLSTRKASLETRIRFLRHIASDNGITLHLDMDVQQGEEKDKSAKLSRSTLTINQNLKRGF